jgi:hypothetical protein
MKSNAGNPLPISENPLERAGILNDFTTVENESEVIVIII